MTKVELAKSVTAFKEETAAALRTMYNALNAGQKKQILKNEAVAALFERYGVERDE